MKRIAPIITIVAIVAAMLGLASANAAPSPYRSILLAKSADGTLVVKKALRGRKADVRYAVVRSDNPAADLPARGQTNFLSVLCQDRVVTPGQFWFLVLGEGAYLKPDRSADGFVGGSFSELVAEGDRDTLADQSIQDALWLPVPEMSPAESGWASDEFMRTYASKHDGCRAVRR